MIEKGDEIVTRSLFTDQVNDFISDPVVSPKDMSPLLLSGCGDPFLRAFLHPAGHQNRQPP
jgi:hypothetical protein